MLSLQISNWFNFQLLYHWLPLLLAFLLGALCYWLLFGRKRHAGDLSAEGEGALRAEADSLRARVRELEGDVKSRDSKISSLTAAGAGAAVGAAAAAAASGDGDDDATYALEWRNRYLAARVKYLEGRLADDGKKKPAAKKKAPAKKTAPAKKKAPAKKTTAKAAPKPKVLYTDGPTDGAPDDLKLIKGIGPKFEKDLNSKGIYYFRQIAAWKKKDVEMVEGVIDSIPGRIERDEWVKQAGGLTKSASPKAKAKKPAAKKSTAKKATAKAAPSGKGRGRPRKNPPKPERGSFEYYYNDVVKYHRTADKGVVEAIIKHLGPSLKNRDSSLVACSDQKEIDTVVSNWCEKKLGQDKDAGVKNAASVCEEMKSSRFKQRVTFYYLCAKNARKLSALK